jgi:hypothetical protein
MIAYCRQSIKSACDIAYSANVVRKGLNEFSKTGATPPEAHGQMVSLYCRTRGVSREILTRWIKMNSTMHSFGKVSGALGSLTPSDCKAVAREIQTHGYYVFPQKLNPEICEKLLNFALSEPSNPKSGAEGTPKNCVYDPTNPLAATYHFSEETMAANAEIQKLICDPTFLAISQAYLKTSPVFEAVAMWWTTAFKKEADSASAQLYHFDMDHNKWVKIFVYLTEVTPANGPHCYIEGTHKPFSKPGALLDRGYVRITDEDLSKCYAPNRFKEVCGTIGTIIIGDTAAFHKGKPASQGDRLVFELEYGDSLFGGNRGQIPVGNPTEDLKRALKDWPSSFSRLSV